MKTGVDRIGRGVSIEQAQRQCFDKVHYANRNAARDRATYVARKYPESLPQRPYKCALCGGFHLTSIKPQGKPRMNNGRDRAKAKQSRQPSQKEG